MVTDRRHGLRPPSAPLLLRANPEQSGDAEQTGPPPSSRISLHTGSAAPPGATTRSIGGQGGARRAGRGRSDERVVPPGPFRSHCDAHTAQWILPEIFLAARPRGGRDPRHLFFNVVGGR